MVFYYWEQRKLGEVGSVSMCCRIFKEQTSESGDILISASGSIGRTVEFTGKNEYFQDSNIVWLSHDDRLDNTFLKCFYSAVKWAGIEGTPLKDSITTTF